MLEIGTTSTATYPASLIHRFVEFLKIVLSGFDVDWQYDVQLAVREALGNAYYVSIAHDWDITLEVTVYPSHIKFMVENMGTFDYSEWMERDLPDHQAVSGRGIWIMRQLTTDMFYTIVNNRTQLYLFFRYE